jgi:hypothetical protein
MNCVLKNRPPLQLFAVKARTGSTIPDSIRQPSWSLAVHFFVVRNFNGSVSLSSRDQVDLI